MSLQPGIHLGQGHSGIWKNKCQCQQEEVCLVCEEQGSQSGHSEQVLGEICEDREVMRGGQIMGDHRCGSEGDEDRVQNPEM